MARFCPLFSSSSGNSAYIGCSGTGILIDAGGSARQLEAALDRIGVCIESIAAIFVTHEHTDHIKGIRVFASRHGLPVFASRGTAQGIIDADAIAPQTRLEEIDSRGVEIAGMFVRPFRTPHDSRESTGFTVVTPDGKRISVATDIGTVTQTVMDAVYGSELILLESNHDVNMLKNGSYPYATKRRILSDLGHLSNDACAEAAVRLLEGGTTRFVLGHLSRQNNLPDLARETTHAAMSLCGARENSDYLLSVAGTAGELITL